MIHEILTQLSLSHLPVFDCLVLSEFEIKLLDLFNIGSYCYFIILDTLPMILLLVYFIAKADVYFIVFKLSHLILLLLLTSLSLYALCLRSSDEEKTIEGCLTLHLLSSYLVPTQFPNWFCVGIRF